MNNFRETGNKVPISYDELLQYVHSKLNEFIATIAQTKSLSLNNPFKNPIIYTTPSGKTIRIPDEIQKKAIDFWIQRNGARDTDGSLSIHDNPYKLPQGQNNIPFQQRINDNFQYKGQNNIPIQQRINDNLRQQRINLDSKNQVMDYDHNPSTNITNTNPNDTMLHIYDNKNNFWVICILILAALLAIFLFFQIGKNNKPSNYPILNTERIKYFLTKN